MSHDVFISYEKGDLSVAEALSRKLEKNGIRVWYAPRDLRAGENWVNALPRAIGDCRVMVLIYSQRSAASKYVLREVESANTFEKPIIPFCLSPIQRKGGLGFIVSTDQWLEAFPPPIGQYFDRLVATVRSTLRAGPGPKTVILPAPPPRPPIDRRLMWGGGFGVLALLAALATALTATGGGSLGSSEEVAPARAFATAADACQDAGAIAVPFDEGPRPLPGFTHKPGRPKILCLNLFQINSDVIRLAGVGVEAVGARQKLANWIEANGGTIDCVPIFDGARNYRCYVGNASREDVATHILAQHWASPGN